tara:strand:+ start:94 stop:396 length:303 start_codon:yes stop_codon:yes gene_type:complete
VPVAKRNKLLGQFHSRLLNNLVHLIKYLVKLCEVKTTIKFKILLSLLICSELANDAIDVLSAGITNPALEYVERIVNRKLLLVMITIRTRIKMLVASAGI